MEQNFVFDPCFNSSLFIINFSLFFQIQLNNNNQLAVFIIDVVN